MTSWSMGATGRRTTDPPGPTPTPPPHLPVARLLLLLLFLHALPAGTAQRFGADNRCFLESGGSSESFFVSEDSPVGSIIGVLSIHGNPLENVGDIVVRLQEGQDTAVSIPPGSKNLTLMRRLDKEGAEGPSSVFINVICDKKGTTEPGLVIPVNIRVTDANDNSPIFVNAPYSLSISEVTVVGTRVLQGINAVDADQLGPYSTVQYQVLAGPNADYFVFANALEGILVLRRPLDYEALANFTVGIRAQDQGNPPRFTDTTLRVSVIDADDQNPRFLDEAYTAVLPDRAIQGTRLRVVPREIAAYDQDVGINAPIVYSFNSAGTDDYDFFEIDPVKGHLTVKRSIPEDDILQPATLVVRATQRDNPDRYAVATLTVKRPGTLLRDLEFLQPAYYAGVLESVPLLSTLITVVTNRPREQHHFWINPQEAKGRFNVTQHGDVILLKPLDYETEDLYLFNVHVTDGRMNASALVNISVLNVNDWDPLFRHPSYEFYVDDLSVAAAAASAAAAAAAVGASPRTPSKGRLGIFVGQVEAFDGDRGDRVTLELTGAAAQMFNITPTGEIILQDVSLANSSIIHMVARATDSGIPPRQASSQVIVHLPEALVAASRSSSAAWASGGGAFLLLAGFGAGLAVLSVVVVLLLLYIYKHKRPKSAGGSGSNSHGGGNGNRVGGGRNGSTKMGGLMASIQHEKLPPSSDDGTDGEVAATAGGGASADPGAATLNKTPRYTATVKSIMSRTSVGRASQRRPGHSHQHSQHSHHGHHGHQHGCSGALAQSKRKVAPAPPQVPVPVPAPAPPATSLGAAAAAGSAATSVSWPAGSIPRRVKKLSWDDEDENKPELDPEVSVTPLASQLQDPNSADQMNLTVYF